MRRLDVTRGETTMRSRSRVGMALAAAVVLATAGMAWADHYPDVPAKVHRKDHAVLDGLARMTYAYSSEATLTIGECNCLEPVCDAGFMLSCGGELEPYYAGTLSAVRRTSRETCLVCGCAWDFATIRATPVCVGF
jgi:hypothetical protein